MRSAANSFIGLVVSLLCSSPPSWCQIATEANLPHHRPFGVPAAISATTSDAEAPANTRDCYKFITIEIDDAVSAVADGINNDKLVTGYYEDSHSVWHGFVWEHGTVRKVDYPGAKNTYLYGVNNKDEAIGYYDDGISYHAVIYSVRSKTWKSLPDIPGYAHNEGYGINDEGVAVGNAYGSNNTSVAWIWQVRKRSYSFFAVPDAAQYTTSPSGLNDKGQIAGYFEDASSVWHGFIKEYGTYTIINVPGATNTYLDGINDRGVIQGQIFDTAGAAEGFIATSGGEFTIVNYPGPEMTAIVGINDAGELCGAYWETFGTYKAFVALRKDE